MSMTFSEALKAAMSNRGISLRKIADVAGVSYEQLKKVGQGKSRSTNVDDAQKVASALNMTLDQFLNGGIEAPNTIAIAGRVGAGAQVPVFDAYAKGDGPQVECPQGLSPRGVVAVEIVGDSMEPIYSAGDLLFYTRHTHDCIPDDVVGHRCVVEDEDGMGWVKQVKPGDEPGLFHLISLNPGATTMWNKRLRWAARVRLHWPAELTRKV
ncbi:XRE family transcriptional regulator [Salipiger bermudensis]|uniref:XRE family transcriptional regulator n=1 Tax=Salipiger bermudensis TaxID=344736 RepID=UPI001CD58D32|nr:S24 family peptidase [Salipiger bermudensis]MCA0961175.1 helix-turn-helix domain-containing protein [Salipiger bermudensis]